MINHTMFVAFDQPIPDSELDQYLTDIERVMTGSGLVASTKVARHLPVPGEENIPALIATAVIQFEVEDLDTLAKAFAAPGIDDVIHDWQSRHPYRVAFANHEPLT